MTDPEAPRAGPIDEIKSFQERVSRANKHHDLDALRLQIEATHNIEIKRQAIGILRTRLSDLKRTTAHPDIAKQGETAANLEKLEARLSGVATVMAQKSMADNAEQAMALGKSLLTPVNAALMKGIDFIKKKVPTSVGNFIGDTVTLVGDATTVVEGFAKRYFYATCEKSGIGFVQNFGTRGLLNMAAQQMKQEVMTDMSNGQAKTFSCTGNFSNAQLAKLRAHGGLEGYVKLMGERAEAFAKAMPNENIALTANDLVDPTHFQSRLESTKKTVASAETEKKKLVMEKTIAENWHLSSVSLTTLENANNVRSLKKTNGKFSIALAANDVNEKGEPMNEQAKFLKELSEKWNEMPTVETIDVGPSASMNWQEKKLSMPIGMNTNLRELMLELANKPTKKRVRMVKILGIAGAEVDDSLDSESMRYSIVNGTGTLLVTVDALHYLIQNWNGVEIGNASDKTEWKIRGGNWIQKERPMPVVTTPQPK